MGRAAAHALALDPRMRDPAAMPLLPESARQTVARYAAHAWPRSLGEAMRFARLRESSVTMAVRTLAIDDAVREAASPQLVILGAGLDGRAFRMPELRETVVFEVDRPDSQRDKQARAAQLSATAKQLHFVPVDFARDSLAEALDRAGHDPAQPTTFLWEGVVMYLSRETITETLRVIAQRAAAGSRLVILYVAPVPLLFIFALMLRFLGEPLRSPFSAVEMRELLGRFGFDVLSDHATPELARLHAPALAKQASLAPHMRAVIAVSR